MRAVRPWSMLQYAILFFAKSQLIINTADYKRPTKQDNTTRVLAVNIPSSFSDEPSIIDRYGDLTYPNWDILVLLPSTKDTQTSNISKELAKDTRNNIYSLNGCTLVSKSKLLSAKSGFLHTAPNTEREVLFGADCLGNYRLTEMAMKTEAKFRRNVKGQGDPDYVLFAITSDHNVSTIYPKYLQQITKEWASKNLATNNQEAVLSKLIDFRFPRADVVLDNKHHSPTLYLIAVGVLGILLLSVIGVVAIQCQRRRQSRPLETLDN